MEFDANHTMNQWVMNKIDNIGGMENGMFLCYRSINGLKWNTNQILFFWKLYLWQTNTEYSAKNIISQQVLYTVDKISLNLHVKMRFSLNKETG